MADLWWVDSGWKVGADKAVPTHESEAMDIGLAANEAEAAQLVVTPRQALRQFRATASDLSDGHGHTLPSSAVEILRVEYVRVVQATDSSSQPGLWPDPLPPLAAPLDLPANINQPLWLRVTTPRDAAAGVYTGRVKLVAEGWPATVPLRVEVFGFTLPDRLTCQTAMGFSPGSVFRYHGLKTEADRRSVLAKYWDSFARHHISPYDPAPLDPIRVEWPAVQPPASKWADWENARIVTNETASGIGALLLFDDRTNANQTVSFHRDLPVKPGGQPFVQPPSGQRIIRRRGKANRHETQTARLCGQAMLKGRGYHCVYQVF